jgi:hypothetical protein
MRPPVAHLSCRGEILMKQRRRSQQFCPAPQPVEWITQPLLLPQK